MHKYKNFEIIINQFKLQFKFPIQYFRYDLVATSTVAPSSPVHDDCIHRLHASLWLQCRLSLVQSLSSQILGVGQVKG